MINKLVKVIWRDTREVDSGTWHDMSDVIKTNSAYQVRQKIYSESLMEWSNYKDHLESLLKI